MTLLALTDVSLSFRRGRRHLVSVLSDVSLAVQPGEVVAVLAQRAQGKTSLLRVAAGMQRPNRGNVSLDGQDLWKLSSSARARLLGAQIGWVGHTAPDLDLPMLTSVALPLLGTHGKREAYKRAAQALERVGCPGLRRANLGQPRRLGARAGRRSPTASRGSHACCSSTI